MKAVILGGTLSAIREALRLRAAGWSVLLCAQSTYLAEDVTATWHGYGVRHQAWLGDRLAAAGLCVEPPFLPGRIKKEALRVLLAADVEVRFMTRAAGLLREEGRIRGVVLARKGGLDREGCDLLLDATLYHVASARLTQRTVSVPAGREVSFSLEYRGIPLAQDVLPLSDNQVLERGPVAQDHAYLTVTHTFAQDTPLEGARAALWRCALHAAKQLAQDERFPHLEMTNALPDQMPRACGVSRRCVRDSAYGLGWMPSTGAASPAAKFRRFWNDGERRGHDGASGGNADRCGAL